MDKKAKILVVDDEEIWRDQIREVLETEGYSITTVDDGEKAIELMKSNYFNLVITDIWMETKYRGLEILSYTLNNFKNTAVIVLTALGTTYTAKNAAEKGAHGFIVKGEYSSSNQGIRNIVAEVLSGQI